MTLVVDMPLNRNTPTIHRVGAGLGGAGVGGNFYSHTPPTLFMKLLTCLFVVQTPSSVSWEIACRSKSPAARYVQTCSVVRIFHQTPWCLRRRLLGDKLSTKHWHWLCFPSFSSTDSNFARFLNNDVMPD